MEIVFNKVLQDRLGDKNLSEVARVSGIPRSLLHDWVSSKRLPSVKNMKFVKSLASYLGLSLDELFFGESGQAVITSVAFEDQGRKYQINIKRIK